MTGIEQLKPTDLSAFDGDLHASVRVANAAAVAAGVTVRRGTELSELTAMVRLFEEIWRPDASSPMSTELLRALSKSGNYVVAAHDGPKLIGACVGFFAAPDDGALHSHIAGVAPVGQGRHVGYALKLHQRAWALQHQISRIEWTFDPLVARNAYFNVVKLGGRPSEYLPNFYGGMRDGINGIDDTDRLLVRWDLNEPRVVDACAGVWSCGDRAELTRRGAVIALGRGAAGEPVGIPGSGIAGAGISLVAVPPDIETLRLTDPAPAREWRAAVREVLGGLLARGARITDFARDGWYVVETP